MIEPAPKIAAIPSPTASAVAHDIFPKNSPIPRKNTPMVATALPARPVSVFTTIHIVLSSVVFAAMLSSGSIAITAVRQKSEHIFQHILLSIFKGVEVCNMDVLLTFVIHWYQNGTGKKPLKTIYCPVSRALLAF